MSGDPWWKRSWVVIAAPLLLLGLLALLGGVLIDDDDTVATTEETAPKVPEVSSTTPPVTSTTAVATTVAETTTTVATVTTTTVGPTTTLVETTTTDAPTTLPQTTAAPTTIPGPQTKNAAIGSTLSLAVLGTTLDVTLMELVDPAPPHWYVAPTAGFRNVALHMSIVNTGAASWNQSMALSGSVIDANGQFSNAFANASSIGPTMLQMWLRPGDTRSGWVTYEVPEDVAAAQFRFTGFREPGADIGLWDLTTGAPLASTPVLTPAEAGFDVAVTVKAPQTDLTARLIGYIEPAPSAQFLTPPPGYHLAAVEMEITNSGAGPYDERAWFSTALIDASGQEYNASIPSSNPLGPPFPDSLPAGASARGIHYFFVLDGASIVKLQFSPKFDTWLDWVEFAIV